MRKEKPTPETLGPYAKAQPRRIDVMHTTMQADKPPVVRAGAFDFLSVDSLQHGKPVAHARGYIAALPSKKPNH